LTGRLTQSAIADGDFRATLPRFQGENFTRNQRLIEQVEAVAKRLGATNGQVALAWVLAQGNEVVPIPGTRRIPYLEENVGAANVQLSDGDLAELNALAPPAGERYATVS
ncbi:MAG TPA: aldo/keto reductase, partial [Candidatus Acidoferrum sp.]|nr:aldo/keto reductase [Candidatus Acidoferrum sp.]